MEKDKKDKDWLGFIVRYYIAANLFGGFIVFIIIFFASLK